MHRSMVLLAQAVRELWIVPPTSGVVFLDAQNASRNGRTVLLAFFLALRAPSGANWSLVSHAAPPFNARYKENSESAGSMATMVPPAVTTSTPAIFFPCHLDRAFFWPRK
jgi:hypothetical protein